MWALRIGFNGPKPATRVSGDDREDFDKRVSELEKEREKERKREERKRRSSQESAHQAVCLRWVLIWHGSICCDPVRNGSFVEPASQLVLFAAGVVRSASTEPREWIGRKLPKLALTTEPEQLLKEWRKVKQALKEAKMNVKDTRKHAKEFENVRESASGGKALRAKVVGQEARDLAKYIRSRFKNKEIWDTAEVKLRSEWESLIPQDRDWETDTKQAVNVVKRTELTLSSMGIVMVSPRNLETVVSQRQYFQNPVLVLVPGSREQIHDAFNAIKLERMQEVMFVVRDPKKPEDPEERGRSTPVTAIQMGKGTIVGKTTEADVANVAVDDSMEITLSICWEQLRRRKVLAGMIMSRNENVSILARYGKKMPNADAGSLDDRRSPCQLIQTIVRLRPAHAKAVLEGRGQGGLFARETIRDGQEPKTKGMPVWADSRWTLEKLQVEMQVVKGVNGFIYRIRTGGKVQFGVRVLPYQLSEVRARMSPNDVRYTDDNRHIQELQQWRLGPLPYTRKLSTCFWNGVGKLESHGQWFRMRQTQDRGPRMDTSGLLLRRPPLNEISLLNGKVFLTREVMQGRERQGKVRPSVWTKLKEEKEHGVDPWTTQDPRSKSTHWYQQ